MSLNSKALSSVILVALTLAGCASGSALVTGQKRSPTDAAAVRIYLEPPGFLSQQRPHAPARRLAVRRWGY